MSTVELIIKKKLNDNSRWASQRTVLLVTEPRVSSDVRFELFFWSRIFSMNQKREALERFSSHYCNRCVNDLNLGGNKVKIKTYSSLMKCNKKKFSKQRNDAIASRPSGQDVKELFVQMNCSKEPIRNCSPPAFSSTKPKLNGYWSVYLSITT